MSHVLNQRSHPAAPVVSFFMCCFPDFTVSRASSAEVKGLQSAPVPAPLLTELWAWRVICPPELASSAVRWGESRTFFVGVEDPVK